MKKFFLVLVMSIVSFSAMASDAVGVNIDGKNISITDVSTSSDTILHSKDLGNGVYIISFPAGIKYQNATSIIRQRFVAAGIKVVDKADGAAVGLEFMAAGDLDIGDADKSAAGSILPNASNIGAMVGSIAGGGIHGAAGFIGGALFGSGDKSVLTALVNLHPVDDNLRKTESKNESSNRIIAKYKLEKGTNQDVVLKMMTDQWINSNVVFDAVPTQPVSASSVSVTVTMAEKK
jgi:hypothetical protein